MEVNPPYPERVNEDAGPEIPGSRGKEKRWMRWWKIRSGYLASTTETTGASRRPVTSFCVSLRQADGRQI